MNNKNTIRGLLKSFYYAFRGLLSCIKNERNFRIHLTACAWVAFFCLCAGLNTVQVAIMAICCGIVLVGELFNTAAEELINLISPEYSPLAGRIKDITAGAVLVASGQALVVGYAIFVPTGKFFEVLEYMLSSPLIIAAAVFSCIATVLFIFWGHILVPELQPIKRDDI